MVMKNELKSYEGKYVEIDNGTNYVPHGNLRLLGDQFIILEKEDLEGDRVQETLVKIDNIKHIKVLK